VLRDVFVNRGKVTKSTAQSPKVEPHAKIHPNLDLDAAVLELESDERVVETPLIEGEYPESTPSDVPEWSQYRTKEFSPYAFGAGNPRSVAALRVKGGAFARKDKRNGATMIPAYFYGAVGCNGEFTKEQQHAPLQLSKQDYRKWDASAGDILVIIGGQSRSSRILNVSSWEAEVVGGELTGERANREAALGFLSDEGYDVGSAGSPNSSSSTERNFDRGKKSIWPARSNPQTDAERLQLRAEQDSIKALTRSELRQVACRHLRYGWQPAWNWFKQQFGATFKPEVTHQQFRSIIEGYPNDYSHVEVPSRQ